MSWFRRPRTMSERRANTGALCRPARRPAQLPTSWNDLPVRARTNRNWKRFRKTRYHRIPAIELTE